MLRYWSRAGRFTGKASLCRFAASNRPTDLSEPANARIIFHVAGYVHTRESAVYTARGLRLQIAGRSGAVTPCPNRANDGRWAVPGSRSNSVALLERNDDWQSILRSEPFRAFSPDKCGEAGSVFSCSLHGVQRLPQTRGLFKSWHLPKLNQAFWKQRGRTARNKLRGVSMGRSQAPIEVGRKERIKRDWAIYVEKCKAIRNVEKERVLAARRSPQLVAAPLVKGEREYALKGFWEDFRKVKNIDARLRLLSAMAELHFSGSSKSRTKKMRKRFDFTKNKYYSLFGPCKVCDSRANVRHHIIQISNGGGNHGVNLIRLCNPCHWKIHPWLRAESA